MAGSGFDFDIRELDKISEAFRLIASKDIENLKNAIGVEEEGQIKERFETKKDPEGHTWADWSPNYQGKGSKLVADGRLQESITFEVTSYGIIWGSSLIYARVHQEGFKDKNIPARPYLGIGEESQFLIAETIEDFIRRESGGLF